MPDMIPQVTHLDGNPALSVQAGEEYLVPCVYGIPIICPSHIDEGTEGPTGRHWHTDDRFGKVGRLQKYWSKKDISHLGMGKDDELKASIISDNGEPVIMERMRAEKGEMWASGGVFTSVCWLYEKMGTLPAKDGHCAHHHTPLVEQDGCFECPAHALRYTLDGQPRYQSPFFISTNFIDFDHNIHRVREPLCTDKDGIKFKVEGNFDPFPLLRLEDFDGESIMECRSDVRLSPLAKPGGTHKLTISIGAWPSSGMCPQLAPRDPRNPKGT